MSYSDHFQELLRIIRSVYTLAESPAQDLGRVAKIRALSLDHFKPHVGLKGSHGLFAFEESWASIRPATADADGQH